MVWVVVTIHVNERLLGHAEIARRLPSGHSTLRQPRRAGVAQRVRDDIIAKTRRPTN